MFQINVVYKLCRRESQESSVELGVGSEAHREDAADWVSQETNSKTNVSLKEVS